jgi:hypothetical protein
MDKLREQIREILGGECQVRWKEQGYNTLCGHPLPCPKHTDIEKWRLEVISAILKLFNKEMLRLIGEDEEVKNIEFKGEFTQGKMIGRNQLRAELRKKVGER